MHQNIKNNNIKSLDAKLYNAKYYDFMLYKGETIHQNVNDLNNMTLADFSTLDIVDGILYSKTSWSGATNEGVELNNIGFTGMDNGLISFKKDRITNSEFLDLLLNSKYSIEEGDNRLFLTPVTGNTQMYDYPMFLYNDGDEKYIVCNGGFYQGFFKLYGHNYEVLPYKLDGEWLMHFDLRPRTDYETTTNTVNYTHKNNDGIFFFMGLRAENKFWPFYKTDSSVMKEMLKPEAQNEGYFDGCGESGETYDLTKNNIVHLENEWVADEVPEFKYGGYFAIGDGYFAPDFRTSSKDYVKPNTDTIIVNNCNSNCKIENYFNDEYYNEKKPEKETGKFVENDFIGSGATISKDGYVNYDGYHMREYAVDEIVTDNKFLLFDRTPNGFTVNNWEEGTKLVLTRRQQWPNANYFLLMNRTCTGYTVDTIQNYNESNEYDYNIHKDIRGNVFALRIKEDGSIGYRYGVFDCETENRYKVIEEYSKPGIIKNDEWNSVNVRFSTINEYRNSGYDRNKKMRIYIYVNGFLVFVSKNIDVFNFRHINKDDSSKQETVPYNISLGGGTLGLLETILPDYYAISNYILPIERDFCGTFIGDIKSFKMYGGFINYSTIKNYLS